MEVIELVTDSAYEDEIHEATQSAYAKIYDAIVANDPGVFEGDPEDAAA